MLAKLLGRFSRQPDPEQNSGIPVSFNLPRSQVTQEDIVKRLIREQLSMAAMEEGEETFEEADDFDVEDDETIPVTHHQVVAMTPEELREVAADYGIDLVDDPDGEAPQEGSATPTTETSSQMETTT